MSVPTESPVNWVKSTAMRIMEDMKQVVIAQDLYFAERWDMGTDCPEERYKVNVGDVEALCNTLAQNNKREAIIRMQLEGVKGIANTSRGFASAKPPVETDEIVVCEIPMEETEPSPVTPRSPQQISSTPPTKKVEGFAPLVAKNESGDFNLREEDYEGVELSWETEIDEEWVNIEYPAGSNGWWRARLRAKGR